MKRRLSVLLLALALGLGWSSAAPGEVFILANGARLEGELLNPDQKPRETYEINTPGGGRITLDRSQVKQVLRRRPEEVEYERIRPRYPDTVEGQWNLAEWCRQRSLLSQREIHLERIIELDPDHQEARRILGYDWHDGEWKTREQKMKERGYVRRGGEWVLPQRLKIEEEQERIKEAESEWKKKLNRWQRWLGTTRDRLARESILSIHDPLAVAALGDTLKDEPRDAARILYIKSLAGIGTPAAKGLLARWALVDPIPEVRLTCLDYLKEEKDPDVTAYFIGKLRSKQNAEINRAAVALGRLGDPTAIGPLIDALVTPHKFKVRQGPGFSTGLGSGPGGSSSGGLTVGGGTKIVTRYFNNQAVLDALVELTGGTSYGFDVRRWKAWYAAQKNYQRLDARRD